MWELPNNIKNDIHASEFGKTSERMDVYYSDHLKRWRLLVEFINELMSTSILQEGLRRASATTIYGETCIILTWQHVYPYEKGDKRWNADDFINYENHQTSINVFVNGFDGEYTIQVGFSVNNNKDILINTSDILPIAEKNTITIPSWWLDSIKNIVNTKEKVITEVVESKKGILSKFWKRS